MIIRFYSIANPSSDCFHIAFDLILYTNKFVFDFVLVLFFFSVSIFVVHAWQLWATIHVCLPYLSTLIHEKHKILNLTPIKTGYPDNHSLTSFFRQSKQDLYESDSLRIDNKHKSKWTRAVFVTVEWPSNPHVNRLLMSCLIIIQVGWVTVVRAHRPRCGISPRPVLFYIPDRRGGSTAQTLVRMIIGDYGTGVRCQHKHQHLTVWWNVGFRPGAADDQPYQQLAILYTWAYNRNYSTPGRKCYTLLSTPNVENVSWAQTETNGSCQTKSDINKLCEMTHHHW